MEKNLWKLHLLFMPTCSLYLKIWELVIMNLIKSSTTKISKNTPSGYSLFTHSWFDTTKTKLDCYRGKYCMERFCNDLKEHVTKIINYQKKTKRNDAVNLWSK